MCMFVAGVRGVAVHSRIMHGIDCTSCEPFALTYLQYLVVADERD